jgi:hypothetical protein
MSIDLTGFLNYITFELKVKLFGGDAGLFGKTQDAFNFVS